MANETVTQEMLDAANGGYKEIRLELAEELAGQDYFEKAWRDSGFPDIVLHHFIRLDEAARGAEAVLDLLVTDEVSKVDQHDNPHQVKYVGLNGLHRGGLLAAQKSLLRTMVHELESLRERGVKA